MTHSEENTRNLFRYCEEKKAPVNNFDLFHHIHTYTMLSVCLSFFTLDSGGYIDPKDNEEVVPASQHGINWFQVNFSCTEEPSSSHPILTPFAIFLTQLQRDTFIVISSPQPPPPRSNSCVCGDLSNHQPAIVHII